MLCSILWLPALTCAAAMSCAAPTSKPDASAATLKRETPAERFRSESQRRQREEDERTRREDFMHRENGRR